MSLLMCTLTCIEPAQARDPVLHEHPVSTTSKLAEHITAANQKTIPQARNLSLKNPPIHNSCLNIEPLLFAFVTTLLVFGYLCVLLDQRRKSRNEDRIHMFV